MLLTSCSWSAEDGAAAAGGTWSDLKLSNARSFRHALALDPATGNLFWSRWGQGVWVSSDQGKTFARADGERISGNPFSPAAIVVSPDGGKIAVFSSQAKALSGHSLDGGKTWTSWSQIGAHGLDYGAVDWESGAILVMPHEERKAYLSADMGKTWTQLPLDYPAGSNNPHKAGQHLHYQAGLGVFGAKELVYSQERGIERSEDSGKTWIKVADHCCCGPVQVFKGIAYWLAKKEQDGKWTGQLIASKDRGKTRVPVGQAIENGGSMYMTVPRFGKDVRHVAIATAMGILESVDSAVTWKLVTTYPDQVERTARFVDTDDCFEFDASRKVFYVYFFKDYGGACWRFEKQ
ncbi:MAG: hypothetical protein NTW87_08800 [Planctomycetota bacterium]|nr:hypothetical protein [Planctomycetota bacterium]